MLKNCLAEKATEKSILLTPSYATQSNVVFCLEFLAFKNVF